MTTPLYQGTGGHNYIQDEDNEDTTHQNHIEYMKRICIRCKSVKEEADFYKNSHPKFSYNGGYDLYCKDCSRANKRHQYAKDPDKERERSIVKYRQNALERKRKMREYAKKNGARRYKEHPEKFQARAKVRYHLKKGTIVKPSNCQKCDVASPSLEGHHDDYSKALEITWLCRKCHGQKHQTVLTT